MRLLKHNQRYSEKSKEYEQHKERRMTYTMLAVVMASCFSTAALAGSLEQAKRIHDRIAGVPPSQGVLLEMKDALDGDGSLTRIKSSSLYTSSFSNTPQPVDEK